MPEFIEIKDEIFRVSSIVYAYIDEIANGYANSQFLIKIGLDTKQEHFIYFDSEEECTSTYLNIRNSLLKNTQKLNS